MATMDFTTKPLTLHILTLSYLFYIISVLDGLYMCVDGSYNPLTHFPDWMKQ